MPIHARTPTTFASRGIVGHVFHRESGQASIEWVALIALVAVVLGAAAALTWGGLGPKVAYALRRGICTVGAERCPAPPPDRADLPPCPVKRSSREQDFHVELSFVDLGGGLGVQEETTSDGRVTVTFTNSGSGGGVAGVGASFQLGSVKADAGVSAEASVRFMAGKSWTFPDVAAADRFVARYGSDQDLARHVLNDARRLCFFCGLLGVHGPPKPPPADVTYLEGGLHLTLGAEAKAIWGTVLSADLEAALGHSDERATGRHTVYVRLSDSASGELFASSGFGTTAGVSGIAQLTVDRHGRPLSLRLETVTTRATLRQEPSYRGPGGDSPQLVKDLRREGTAKELEADLDLTEPAAAAAARTFLHGEGAGALLRELAAHGNTTLRTFAAEGGSGGVGATLAFGAEAGGGLSHSSQRLELTGVYTRLPGLGFLPRADCLVT